MNIILLSGGSGKRLWPLSNDVRSKQFIKIFPSEYAYESMVQRMYRQIKEIDKNAVITIATSKTQVSAIHNQLGKDIEISVEPSRRDTFPAISLACAYLDEVKKISKQEAVVVVPVDPYVDEGYFLALTKLCKLVEKSDCNLTLMGINPTYPSEKYGYIIPRDSSEISFVKSFQEKPNKTDAKEYIEQGALWNSGVFAFRLQYVLDKSEELLGYRRYKDLYDNYDALEKISFDYAVAEKEPSIQVMRFGGIWKDLGTWNTLTEGMEEKIIGNARMNDGCQNLHILNELDIPILAMGLKDMVISASPEGILVSDKEQSSYIKPFVDEISQQVMFADKSWGSYRVLDVGKGSLTIKIGLKTGCRMSYHSHQNRDEVWIIINGRGKAIIDGREQYVKIGDSLTMKAGCAHTITADTELELIEVQIGRDISVSDKYKPELCTQGR
ncbi:cupin domain-containing protein [Clostridiaceae bacterium]|nr:cupin domain-containing protein [Clostridiaceae bacterium]RKI12926.1 cupin domain-containing protein [bacterium 1XD21-70]